MFLTQVWTLSRTMSVKGLNPSPNSIWTSARTVSDSCSYTILHPSLDTVLTLLRTRSRHQCGLCLDLCVDTIWTPVRSLCEPDQDRCSDMVETQFKPRLDTLLTSVRTTVQTRYMGPSRRAPDCGSALIRCLILVLVFYSRECLLVCL